MAFAKKASMLAGCGVLLIGGSRWVSAAVATPQTYAVTVDTSSLAGLSGEFEFQLYLGDVSEKNDRDNIKISNVVTDSIYTVGQSFGVVTDPTTTGALLQGGANNPGIKDNDESEYHLAVSSFGDSLSFTAQLEGNELQGELPDAFGFSGFALQVDAFLPDDSHPGSFFEAQELMDDDFDTVGIAVDGSGNLVTDSYPGEMVSLVSVPEPASATMLGVVVLGLLGVRRRVANGAVPCQ